MDGLPLALVQAGAYVVETGCSLSDYLDLYKTHHKELLARHSRLMLDYPETVATTWSLSFQQIEQQSSIAADLLRLCAFLAPDAIPEELLLRGIAEPERRPWCRGCRSVHTQRSPGCAAQVFACAARRELTCAEHPSTCANRSQG